MIRTKGVKEGVIAGRTGTHKPNKAWDPSIPQRTYELCLLGFTDKALAAAFQVNENLINYWKRVHPEFANAVRRGRAEADGKVALALYQSAVGYTYDEEQAFYNNGNPVVVTVRRYSKPNPYAAIKWLGVRQREYWSEVFRVESKHSININFTQHVDMSDFTEAELHALEKVGLQQLARNAGRN